MEEADKDVIQEIMFGCNLICFRVAYTEPKAGLLLLNESLSRIERDGTGRGVNL